MENLIVNRSMPHVYEVTSSLNEEAAALSLPSEQQNDKHFTFIPTALKDYLQCWDTLAGSNGILLVIVGPKGSGKTTLFEGDSCPPPDTWHSCRLNANSIETQSIYLRRLDSSLSRIQSCLTTSMPSGIY